MKVILTEEQFNRVILNEGVVEVLQDIYDGIRDRGYNIFYVVKLLGKLGYSIPKWTFKKEHKRLEGESDDEWSARIKKLMKDDVDRWLSIQEKKHPQYRVRRAISRVKKQLKELGDITYDKLATDPDNFSDFQKELLLKNLEVTDTGVGRKITEGWFDRKREIKSFQDYQDYVQGIDTTIVVYDTKENFLISRSGEYGDEYTLHTLPKEKYSKDQAVAIGLDISGEDNFPNKRSSYSINESGYEKWIDKHTYNQHYYEEKFQELIDDETLISPEHHKYNFYVTKFPNVDADLSIVITDTFSPTSSAENIYDLSIDQFIEYIQQGDLIQPGMEENVRNILHSIINNGR